MRLEVTLSGWEAALTGYSEYAGFFTDLGWQEGKVCVLFRFFNNDENVLRFSIWPELTSRQIIVADVDKLAQWVGSVDFVDAEVSQIGFEFPWQGNGKVYSQWSSATTTFHYVGFLATKEEAMTAGNGAEPSDIFDSMPGDLPGATPPAEIDPASPANAAGLPDDMDYGLGPDELPGYVVLPGVVTYAFGSAVDSMGRPYSAEFGGRITRLLPDARGKFSLYSERQTVADVGGGLFSLVIDRDDEIYYGSYATHEVRRLSDNKLIFGGSDSGVLRPNQLSSDAAGNLYCAFENGIIQKWDVATDNVSTIATGVAIAQGVGSLNGTIYYTNYTRTDPRCDPSVTGTPLDGYVGGSGGNGAIWRSPASGEPAYGVRLVGATVQEFYRNRGMAVDASHIYVCEESNAWDQGNAARITRYNPGVGSLETLFTAADYPQFPVYSPHDERLYFTLARDYRAAAYDPALQFMPQAVGQSGVKLALAGGSWNNGGSELTITLRDPGHPSDSVTFSGRLGLEVGHAMISGWMRVSDDFFPQISKAQLAGGGADGRFVVPEVLCSTTPGECRAVVLALRQHDPVPRWPAEDCGLLPNPAFKESPEEYLVYFEVLGAAQVAGVPAAGRVGLLLAFGSLGLCGALFASSAKKRLRRMRR